MGLTAVVIGRFQVPDLTAGHAAVLRYAASREHVTTVLVLIGVAATRATQRDPLNFETRAAMITRWYEHEGLQPPLVVAPLPDQPTHMAWARGVDAAVVSCATIPARIFGGRDSALGCYVEHGGHWPVEEIDMVTPDSGTILRDRLKWQPSSSRDFRAGVIYAVMSAVPAVYPTVDVVIHRKQEVLLARKPNDVLWRFPGGFCDPTDHSLEYAAAREAREETGLEIGPPVYVGSSQIADWRYLRGPEAILSAVFVAQYIFGHPVARDDIAAVKWVPRPDVAAQLVPEHAGLWTLAQPYLEQLDTLTMLRILGTE